MEAPRTPRTPRSLNAVRELLGWNRGATLHGHLKTCGIWIFLEWCALALVTSAVGGHLHLRSQIPNLLPMCLLLASLGLVTLRCLWVAYLVWRCHQMKGIGIKEAIYHLGQSRSWSCLAFSMSLWTVGSIFLMIWYPIIAVIILTSDRDGQPMVFALGLVLFFLAIVNALIWKNMQDASEEERWKNPADPRIPRLRKMYESSKIGLVDYRMVASQNENVASKCVVCFEDFCDDEKVARLPCGHVYHPYCSHMWIRSHWNCPLRCNIGFSTKKGSITGAAPAAPRAAMAGISSIGGIEQAAVLELADAVESHQENAAVGLATHEVPASVAIEHGMSAPLHGAIASPASAPSASARLRRVSTCPVANALASTPLLRRVVTFELDLEAGTGVVDAGEAQAASPAEDGAGASRRGADVIPSAASAVAIPRPDVTSQLDMELGMVSPSAFEN